MGKKSVMDSPLLPPAQAVDAPAEQSAPAELLHEFLRVALREQVETRDSAAKNQVSCRLFPLAGTVQSHPLSSCFRRRTCC